MTTRAFARRLAPALLAALLASGASVALAQGKADSADDDTEPSMGERACAASGCTNGTRVCGSVSWSEWIWIYTPWFPIPWKFTQNATCYEPSPEV